MKIILILSLIFCVSWKPFQKEYKNRAHIRCMLPERGFIEGYVRTYKIDSFGQVLKLELMSGERYTLLRPNCIIKHAKL